MVVTAQFKADVLRAIEKIQNKNEGPDNFDNELVDLIRQEGSIQYVGPKIIQRFDLALGVAMRVKNGEDGILVQVGLASVASLTPWSFI